MRRDADSQDDVGVGQPRAVTHCTGRENGTDDLAREDIVELACGGTKRDVLRSQAYADLPAWNCSGGNPDLQSAGDPCEHNACLSGDGGITGRMLASPKKVAMNSLRGCS